MRQNEFNFNPVQLRNMVCSASVLAALVSNQICLVKRVAWEWGLATAWQVEWVAVKAYGTGATKAIVYTHWLAYYTAAVDNTKYYQSTVTPHILATTGTFFIGVGLQDAVASDYTGGILLAIKDTTVTIPAIIDSSTATVTTTSTTASISGIDIISDGGYPVTEVGVVYYLSSEVQANRFKGISPSTTGTLADPYSVSLTGLISNSSYLAKPYVITSQGTFYGSEVAVNTLFNFTGFRLGGAAFLTDTNLSVPLALTPKSAFPNIVSNYGAAFNENDGFIYSAPTANTNKYNATTGALVTTGNTNWTINDDTFMYKPTNTAYISRGSAGGLKKCVLSSFPTTSTVGSFSTWVYSSCIIVWGFIYAAANTSLLIRKINLTTELEVANVGVGTSAKILWADSTYIYVADNTNIKQIRMSDMVQTATVAFAGAFVISGLVYNGFLYTGESGLTTLRRYNTSTMTFSSALGTIPGASKIIENNGIIYTSDQNVPATLSSINPTSFTVISQQTFTTGAGAATYFLKV